MADSKISALASHGVPVNADYVASVLASGPTSKKLLISDLKSAVLASSALTGNPTAPTQSPGNNSTRLATTAYTDTAVGGVAITPPGLAAILAADVAVDDLFLVWDTSAATLKSVTKAELATLFGGSGGSGDIHAVFSATADGPHTVDSIPFIPVADMTYTFTLAATSDVLVSFTAYLTKRNSEAVSSRVYLDGVAVRILPQSASAGGTNSDADVQSLAGTTFLAAIAAGTHTIDMYHAQVAGTNPVTFGQRTLTVQIL